LPKNVINHTRKKRCLVIGYYHHGCGPKKKGVEHHRGVESLIERLKHNDLDIIRYSKNYINNSNHYYGKPISSWILSRLAEGLFSKFAMKNPLPTDNLKISKKIQVRPPKITIAKTIIQMLRIFASIPWLISLKINRFRLIIGFQPPISLIYAANILKIPIIDIMHGYTIYKDHFYYGYHNAFKPKNDLPSTICTLDRNSEIIIKKWALLKKIKVYSVKNFQNKLINDHGNLLKLIKLNKDRGKLILLVTLGWDIDKHCFDHPHKDGELHPKIFELLKKIKKNKKIFTIVRAHPMLNRKPRVIKKLRKISKYLEAEFDNSKMFSHLYDLIDTHISTGSSTIKELAMFGTKTLYYGDAHTLERDFFLEHKYNIAMYASKFSTKSIINFILKNKKVSANKFYLNKVEPKYNIEHIVEKLL